MPTAGLGTHPIDDTLPLDAAAFAHAAELSAAVEPPPSTVPGYHILHRLGAGKFGSVWLAREQNTGKQVAIKFYSQRRGVDWSLLSREVEKLAVLYTSRNIVGLIAVGWDHDPPYYVMEYLERGSLAERLQQGPLPAADALRIAKRVAQALVHAHGSGILHCDLKPANVLLDQDDEPRLCDFGQSRLADEHGHALGTLFYMAPEQADLKSVPDARWDVYALGALMYHLLVGEPPHRTPAAEARLREPASLEQRLAIYRQIVQIDAKPTAHRRIAGVDPVLAEIIDRCLAVDPSRRLPNAQAVLDRLLARERQRARRPLILTGLVLPLLLLLSVIPFALDALRVAVTTSRSNLIQRAIESDVLSANLLAGSLQRELDDRLNELLTIAEDDDIRAAIQTSIDKPRDERLALFALLDRRRRQVNDRRAELNRSGDVSWFLQDTAGFQRWRSPASETIDRCFACRDYFHGQGSLKADGEGDERCVGIPPITRPHVSQHYASETSGDWKIALSVPVFDRASDSGGERRVIAVLARSLNLSALLADYEQSLAADNRGGVGRKLALVDGRSGILLAHPWMTAEHLSSLANLNQDLRLDEETAGQLAKLVTPTERAAASDHTDRYADPIARLAPTEYGGEWLAAFVPIGSTGWVAVVQEPRTPVLAPVVDLQERLVSTGIVGLLMVCLVVAGGWGLIVGLLNERRAPWFLNRRNATTRAAGTTLTATGRTSDSV
ncbi:MAG: serine/threonine protein kinase [Planctomycetaceae bacterium]|nr:serine/threonine protein kinase [Planctomycetaceae bacterium]